MPEFVPFWGLLSFEAFFIFCSGWFDMPTEILKPSAFLSLACCLLEPHAAFYNLLLGLAVRASENPQSTSWGVHILSPTSESLLLALQVSPSSPLILAECGPAPSAAWPELRNALHQAESRGMKGLL